MEKNHLQYCFDIYSIGSLLWWIAIICFLGALITAAGLRQINKFLVDKEGSPFSVMKLQRAFDILNVNSYLSKLSTQVFIVIRKHLVLDFFFMPFLYVLMWCITSIILRGAPLNEQWNKFFTYLAILPFIIWIFDVVETGKTLRIIKDYKSDLTKVSKTQVVIMATSSGLKWLFGGLWLFCILAYLIVFIVEKGF